MELIVLAVMLWLPVVLAIAAVVVALGLIAWFLRRRALARGARSGIAQWPAAVAVALVVMIVAGAGPAIALAVYWKLGSGDGIDAVGTRMTRLHYGCARLPIARLTGFIAQQRPEYRHELEGRLLRRVRYCSVPRANEALPDTAHLFSADERDALRRIAATHRWRAAPDAAARGEPYRESWADDADAIDGLLLWQERGLDVFDAVSDTPDVPHERRAMYLNLAALHCLENAFAGDCPQRLTPPRLERLTHDRQPLLRWSPGLLERLRSAARAAPPPYEGDVKQLPRPR